ncbi:MAG: zinc-binding dehydrogenase [[Clostridium] scindens]
MNECFSAARNFTVEGKDVLVYGAGPMGLATMRYMRYLGAKTITVIDGVKERLELAKTLSQADETINFNEVDKAEVLKGRQFDRVIDIVGMTSILLEGSQYLRPYGIAGSMGVLRNTDKVMDLSKVKNNTLVQMLNFPYGQFDITMENIELMQKGIINPKDFYSHVMSVEDIEEVVRLVAEKKAIKVILDLQS